MRKHDLSNNPMQALQDELAFARSRFPSNSQLMEALMEEVGEVARAVLERDFDHAKQEALQVACVAMRLATEGDQSWEPSRPEDRFTVAEMVDAFWEETQPGTLTRESFMAWVQGLMARPKRGTFDPAKSGFPCFTDTMEGVERSMVETFEQESRELLDAEARVKELEAQIEDARVTGYRSGLNDRANGKLREIESEAEARGAANELGRIVALLVHSPHCTLYVHNRDLSRKSPELNPGTIRALLTGEVQP